MLISVRKIPDLSKISRKIFKILSMVLILGIFLSIPMFAETQDELKQIFVTREEWDRWINVDGITVDGTAMGMSEYLNKIEVDAQSRVQVKVQEDYLRRGLKLPTEESSTTS